MRASLCALGRVASATWTNRGLTVRWTAPASASVASSPEPTAPVTRTSAPASITSLSAARETPSADESVSVFSELWLRDHCVESLHPTSKQRQIDTTTLVPMPSVPHVEVLSDSIGLRWPDGTTVTLPQDFLWDNDYSLTAQQRRTAATGAVAVPWRGRTLDPVRLALDAHGQVPRAAFATLLRDGIVMLQGVPTDMERLAPIATQFGTVRRTFYTPTGHGVWDTAPKNAEAVNDTAYTSMALPPHTDATYYSSPPGLQAFCCQAQAGAGGRTLFVDGYEIARELRRTSPDAYAFFATTPLEFYALEPGVDCRATGTVFHHNALGHLMQFRYNNDDRAPLRNLAPEAVDAFYTHLPTLTAIMRDPALGHLVRLEIGEMAIVNNHRVLHGREAFEGSRNMIGFYTDIDDFLSTCRAHGLDADDRGLDFGRC